MELFLTTARILRLEVCSKSKIDTYISPWGENLVIENWIVTADSGSADEYNEDYFNFYDFTATIEDTEAQEENADKTDEVSSGEDIEGLPRSIYCDLVSTYFW